MATGESYKFIFAQGSTVAAKLAYVRHLVLLCSSFREETIITVTNLEYGINCKYSNTDMRFTEISTETETKGYICVCSIT